MFTGILIQNDADGYRARVATLQESDLPEGDVVIAVSHSTLNYKDALAITGKGRVVRTFPMVPGIDLAGEVVESASELFKSGDKVILNGWGVGETHWGGLAEKARLRGEWLVPLPEVFTPKQAMIIGTAGYTAMLAVLALEAHGVTPEKGAVLVTGANGGVGSFAIAILSRLGYQAVAATGRVEEADYLQKRLGAAAIIPREEISAPGKPLMREQWAGAIDSLGGTTLANVCASIMYGGAVAACGLAQGMDFPATVAPFILRGITLAGIDSVMRPYADRIAAWKRLAEILDPPLLNTIGREISLDEAIPMASQLLEGKVRGRIVVKVGS